ncbi:SRPBCC family protein [Nonomuraea sp. SBT364]|uniref:SRPBCC family protein n=1 Tax=Nonomuraea sp. SBT364 TaxID=1580530 RepID=UPI00066EA60A|nr:SRPBCC family protein [Nonomuraea sp. SBT364]
MNIIDEISRAHRRVSEKGDTKTVVLSRHYDSDVEDVWDALTTAERIGRWLMPVSGDLRLGGKYQLEGNAGGEVLRCEPPALLAVTWVFGDAPASEVEVTLAADGDGTRFELVHTAVVPDEFWSRYGPGAVGSGWDLALLGLSMHLSGGVIPDHDRLHETEEGRAAITASSRAWGEAHLASGADPAQVAAATAATTAFYAPEPE